MINLFVLNINLHWITFNLTNTFVEVVGAATHEGVEVKDLKIGKTKCKTLVA